MNHTVWLYISGANKGMTVNERPLGYDPDDPEHREKVIPLVGEDEYKRVCKMNEYLHEDIRKLRTIDMIIFWAAMIMFIFFIICLKPHIV